jgi:peptidoglycan hydrolase CwlO-like protein
MSLTVCSENHTEIVYEDHERGCYISCPLCAAKKEIEEHEKTNSELKDDIETKIEKIVELQEEITDLNDKIKHQEE